MNVNIMASSGNDPRLTQGTVVFSNLKLDLFLRWDAPFRWSSLYYHMRNSDLTTIGEKKGIPCTCLCLYMYKCKYMFMRKDTKRNIIVLKPLPMILLLIPNCGADNAGTKFIFFLLSSMAIQFIVRIKLSGISDPSVTGVETSLNAG